MVWAYIHTSRPISKDLNNFLYAFVCLLASMPYIHVCLSRSRLCHALCPSWAYACRSLGPLACVVASVPLVACLGVTTCENTSPWCRFAWCIPFLCSMRCYACFVPHIRLPLLLCIFAHLPTSSCMSPCLLVSSSLILTISCGFTPIFDTREPESHLGILLDDTCVIHTPISWNYGHPIQTYICHPRTFPFVW